MMSAKNNAGSDCRDAKTQTPSSLHTLDQLVWATASHTKDRIGSDAQRVLPVTTLSMDERGILNEILHDWLTQKRP